MCVHVRVHARVCTCVYVHAHSTRALSPSLTCSFREMPRTGPRWMRFIKCCVERDRQERESVSVSKWLALMQADTTHTRAQLHNPATPASLRPPRPPQAPQPAAHRGEAGNLVAQALGLDDGDLLAHTVVGGEVLGQAVVVLLDDDLRVVGEGAWG